VNKWADEFKEAWEDSDFTEIGGIVGQKLKEALDDIPWDGIKESAKKVAKSTATFLNGFFETEGLSQSIGHTIAEAFNTGFDFVNTFLENFHFDSFGKFISSGIQAAIERFEWSQIGRLLSNSIIAALDFGTGFLDGVDWDKLGTQIYNALKDIVTTIKYKEIAEKLFDLFGKAIEAARKTLGGFFSGLAGVIEKAITDETGNVSWTKIGKGIISAFTAELDFTKPIREFAKSTIASVIPVRSIS
jgi:hypothetical protein